MTARTTRRTRLLAAVTTTAGALALTLLPTTAAYAAVPTVPVFSYVDNATLVPRVGPANAATTDSLVPDGYRAYDLDVTPDGATSVMSLCNGSIAACTDTPAGSRFDATYGVLLLHTESPSVVSSRLLTNLTSTNAVISADGSKAMWIYGSTLHIFDTATETYSTSALAAPAVATEFPVRLAVSADGSNVAVMYRDDTAAVAGRVVAFPLAGGMTSTSVYFAKSYPKTVTAPAKPLRPSSATFGFVDATHVVYNEYDGTTAPTSTTTRDAVQGTLSLNNATGGGPLAATLQNYYRLRQDAAGNWWAWKDLSTTDVQLAFIPAPLDLAVVPEPDATRTDSDHTYGYTPSTVAPPVLPAPVPGGTPVVNTVTTSNPAVSHPAFGFTARTVVFGGKTAYQTYNLYGGLPNGAFPTNSAAAAETDRGALWRSYDGGGPNTAKWLDTSGAKAFVVGSSYYNGYATSLKRNTWFQWRSAGDDFTTPFTTAWIKVSVVPVVTAKVTVSGSSRIVTGTATRPAGTVYLQKYVSGKWYTVTRVALVKTGSYTGRFTFPKLALKKASYRTITVSDTYAAAGYKIFVV